VRTNKRIAMITRAKMEMLTKKTLTSKMREKNNLRDRNLKNKRTDMSKINSLSTGSTRFYDTKTFNKNQTSRYCWLTSIGSATHKVFILSTIPRQQKLSTPKVNMPFK